MINFLFLGLSLFLLVQCAAFAIRYASNLAKGLRVSRYLVGFLLLSVISVLPETFVSIASALQNRPSFGLGTLFGSNVADLTLVFAVVIFISNRNVKVESTIIKNSLLYILAMTAPIIFGLDGHYTRIEGVALMLVGAAFYTLMLTRSNRSASKKRRIFLWKDFTLLLGSMVGLLVVSNLTVHFGVALAEHLRINPVLVAMLLVGLGTTLPEMFFSIKAIKSNRDSLAMGDVLGTVITDATIIVGLLAVIHPFSFNQRIVYVTGMFMVFATVILMYCMKTGKILTKREGLLLLFYYIFFILVEFSVGNYLTNLGL